MNATKEIQKAIALAPRSDVEIACELGISVSEVRSTLVDLESRSLAIQDGDDWKLARSAEPETLVNEILDYSRAISSGFYEIGKRLRELQDQELYYKLGHDSFEAMVVYWFPFTPKRASQLMSASIAFEDIRSVINLPESVEILESHIRPIATDDLKAEARREIWEGVEQIVLEELADKPASKIKLNAKVIKRSLLEYRERQIENPPELPPLEVGDWVRVALRSYHLGKDCPLRQWNGKAVKVIDVNSRSIAVEGIFGEEIEERLFRDELQKLEGTATEKLRCEIPIAHLDFLRQLGEPNLSQVILKMKEILSDSDE